MCVPQFRNSNKNSHSLTYMVFSESIRCIGMFYSKELCFKIYSKKEMFWDSLKWVSSKETSATSSSGCCLSCNERYYELVLIAGSCMVCCIVNCCQLNLNFPHGHIQKYIIFIPYERKYLEVTTKSSWELLKFHIC